MTASGNKTFYEVLGVARNAKVQEIGLAYQRLRTDLQRESSAPNPRLAAMAKVAYETLSDPARRAEYDASLAPEALPLRVAKRRGSTALAASLAVLVAIGGAGYYFLAHRSPRTGDRQGEGALSPQEIQQAMAPKLGRVQGALMSGEVRDLGVAVAVAADEMVTTCRGMVPGMTLTVRWGESTSKAELARASEELDVCALSVKGAGAGLKMRTGVPGPREKITAVFVDAEGKPQARPASVVRALAEAPGPAFELKSAAPLPNGAALFDPQSRLVGIVVAPHAAAEGAAFALGAARIAQARGSAAEAPVEARATPSAVAPANEAIQVASSTPPKGEAADEPPVPGPGPGPRGTIVDEGFTTLWKEDARGSLIEVLDHPETGSLGDPVAYWTLWKGRDVASNPQTHCLVTYGEDDEVVADYDQVPGIKSPDGYWYCALTRFQVDLDDLPVGDYTFTIFVDGQPVAEGSTRIEKKFWNRGKYAVIVIVLGLALLYLARRKKRR